MGCAPGFTRAPEKVFETERPTSPVPSCGGSIRRGTEQRPRRDRMGRAGAAGRSGGVSNAGGATSGPRLRPGAPHRALEGGRRRRGAGGVRARVAGAAALSRRLRLRHLAPSHRRAAGARSRGEPARPAAARGEPRGCAGLGGSHGQRVPRAGGGRPAAPRALARRLVAGSACGGVALLLRGPIRGAGGEHPRAAGEHGEDPPEPGSRRVARGLGARGGLMRCAEFVRWLDRERPEERAAAAREHAAGCASCARRWAADAALDRLLAEALPPAPLGFSDRLMARLPERRAVPVLLGFETPWWLRAAADPAAVLALAL